MAPRIVGILVVFMVLIAGAIAIGAASRRRPETARTARRGRIDALYDQLVALERDGDKDSPRHDGHGARARAAPRRGSRRRAGVAVAGGLAAVAIDRVTVAKVAKRYGHERALAGVDLELGRGSLCALLGPNGAGKSTLLGILSTLIRPTAGKVGYLDGDREHEHDADLRREIGVLAHASLCYGELDAVENLRFFGGLYDVDGLDARIEELLTQVGLDAAARVRQARTYSRGMLQRLALARALLARPSLLLLDEPFTGLDRTGAAALAAALARAKETGAILVVVTHDLEAIADITDHVVVLRRGRLAHEDRRPDARGTTAGGYAYGELKELYHRYAD